MLYREREGGRGRGEGALRWRLYSLGMINGYIIAFE